MQLELPFPPDPSNRPDLDPDPDLALAWTELAQVATAAGLVSDDDEPGPYLPPHPLAGLSNNWSAAQVRALTASLRQPAPA